MSTVSEIVQAAFREGNFVAVGETPTPEEILEAVPRLRNLVDALFGIEIGESYRDWYVPSEFSTSIPLRDPLSPASSVTASASESWKYPPQNVRMLVKTTAARTIYFPANPNDGARIMFVNIASAAVNITLDGNGHLIENAVSVVGTVTALHGKSWFYRADLGDWVSLSSIVDENSNMPLPEEFDDYFICGLAIRFAPRYQVSIAEETASRFTDMRKRLKARYKQSESMPSSYGELSATSAHVPGYGL